MKHSFKHVLGIYLFALFYFQTVVAEVPACYHKIEETFFNPTYVTQALAMHRYIFQSTWIEINSDLQHNAKRIHDMVQKKAAKMSPNPFGPPYKPLIVAKLLEAAQIEVLAMTLSKYGVKNPSQVMDIYNYIRERQLPMWEECFGVEEEEHPTSK